jgi:hypothetical protein
LIDADFETLPEERRRFAILKLVTSSARLPAHQRAAPL